MTLSDANMNREPTTIEASASNRPRRSMRQVALVAGLLVGGSGTALQVGLNHLVPAERTPVVSPQPDQSDPRVVVMLPEHATPESAPAPLPNSPAPAAITAEH